MSEYSKITKEEIVINISKDILESLKTNTDCIVIARVIYEKYIESLNAKLQSRETKHKDSFCEINKTMNDYMSLVAKHWSGALAEKDERISCLEKQLVDLIKNR